MTEHGDRDSEKRPVPVRQAMGHLRSRKGAGEDEQSEGDPTPSLARTFEADGVRWIARAAGESAFGGNAAFARIVAIHFFREDDQPERPRLEGLLPAGRLEALYEEELVELLERAVEIDPPEGEGRGG